MKKQVRKAARKIHFYLSTGYEVLNPSSVREKVTFFILIIALIVPFISLIPALSNSFKQAIGIIILSISYSAIAASIIEYINQITQKIENKYIQRKFVKLFGYEAKKDKQVIILLPAFEIDRKTFESQSSPTPLDSLPLKEIALKDLSRIATRAAVESDVTSASSVTATFSQLGFHTPEIQWDEDYEDKISHYLNPNSHQTMTTGESRKIYILIGLCNKIFELCDKISNSDKKRYFKFPKPTEGGDVRVHRIYLGYFHKDNSLANEEDWDLYEVKLNTNKREIINNYDFGLFAKIYLDGATLIVLGGATEHGTKRLGDFIKNGGWQEVYSELVQEKKSYQLM